MRFYLSDRMIDYRTKGKRRHFSGYFVVIGRVTKLYEPQDLLLFRKFVRRMKGSKRKIVNGQIFEKAANLGP